MWSISTRGIRSIHSYEAAAEFWADSKPWDNKPNAVPLDDRRMQHKSLVKNALGEYECTLFQTAMVTYAKDAVYLRCDNRVSSNMFSNCVAPAGCQPVSHKGTMFWQVSTEAGQQFLCEGVTPLKLQLVSPGIWTLVNKPGTPHEWVYDRKLGAAARKAVKLYCVWYETSLRLGMDLPTHVHGFDYAIPQICELLEKPDVLENFPALARRIGPPINAVNSAYLMTGARKKMPVPFHRLPRT